MPDTVVHGNYAFTITDLEGAEELKCFAIDLPSGTVQMGTVKHFSGDKGKPAPLSGGGHQSQWNPITIQRYKDQSRAFYEWFKAVQEKGAVEGETKKSPTITCYSNDTVLFSWKLTNAVITGYSQNAANAQTHDLITETATLSFEEAEQLAG
jgi:phage tail-like protein